MKELIGNLVKQADIDESTAEKVLDVVKDFLGDKLPGPMASQVTNILDGVDGEQVSDALDSVKGLFGK
jgi:hypothetical protein